MVYTAVAAMTKRLSERDRAIVARTLAAHYLPAPQPAAEIKLTVRQREVLTYVADGQSTVQVAQNMGITARGVQDSLEAMRKKFGVRTTTHMIAQAFRCGVLS